MTSVRMISFSRPAPTGTPSCGVSCENTTAVPASAQGLTLVHVGAQLEQLQDTFMR
jgi:hypothetical protein